ncbi:MAG TPA: hypothetical protein VFS97_04645 [Nitrososphaeraceae archaeon]|nr:hypothetical protein [Nitrososphaeraceae archaeon]
MKYDAEIEEKSPALEKLQSDSIIDHNLNLNPEAMNFVKLEIDEIKKKKEQEIRILLIEKKKNYS